MKNKLSLNSLLIGKGIITIAIVIIFGFITIGCPTEEGKTTVIGLQGRWKYNDLPSGSDGAMYIIFSGNTFEYEITGDATQFMDTLSGTFTFTENTITFTDSSSTSWDQSYSFPGGALRLEQAQNMSDSSFNNFFVGSFERQ
jgi:hypothetical protein